MPDLLCIDKVWISKCAYSLQSGQVGVKHPLYVGNKCACAIMTRVYS